MQFSLSRANVRQIGLSFIGLARATFVPTIYAWIVCSRTSGPLCSIHSVVSWPFFFCSTKNGMPIDDRYDDWSLTSIRVDSNKYLL
ncbi:hypothetical protein ABKN59_001295 [Abortiporus biennis]